ncbi:asparagine synthase (glutamine-hydrolyzing) [Sulfurovum sp. bin170]|uniref:asparagine synthase (glutamine-hydrolyzing) n=1 Tax=Sulfurovum sp. bin170 TaxID=2695268 RepID=UPI0013DF344F|nr:asparagine synthase (glutamine-hydrolyzing) [Sulfurovum sp. bin170]NEW61435.1 asparagine synthase (glutamine-hydrolyzing) [Sulfurovum sp. bin170]
MCGIVGNINFNNKVVEEKTLAQMMKKIKHRGPDDEGIFIDDSVGLGFVRLSIIDLSSAGHQPMYSDDERLVLIFNGEVYNYIELREELIAKGYKFKSNSDTEVVLKSYQEWGEKCLDRFNGMWAFVIYDRETKKIFGARDRFGIKPFYYYKDSDKFIFASEIKAIKEVVNNSLSINDQAVFDYLTFNRTDYGDRTFYSEIYKIPHGHCFTLNPSGEFKLRKWYDLKSNCNKESIDAKEYQELFTSSVKLRMRSDVPVGVCLSGGLDSSSVISIISKKLNIEDINSFSAVYEKGQIGDESEFIDEMGSYLKNMNYTTPTAKSFYLDMHDLVNTLDEPVPTTSIYAQYEVMKLAKKHASVTLDGQGADEQLAGYHYFYGFYFKELLKGLSLAKLSYEIFHYIKKHKSTYGLKTFLFFLLPERLKINFRVQKASYIQNDFYKDYNQKSVIAGELYGSSTLKDSLINHFEYKLEHLLKWEDLNSMRFSIESRVPFLDYRLVEQTLSLSNDSYIKKGLTKHILRESMKSIVPEKIRLRYDKLGFETPEDEWFRENYFQDMIFDILNNPTSEFIRYIDTQKALDMYREHLDSKINCSKDIWKWINLDLWLKNR